VAILAPHGGKIERWTSDIAAPIAVDTYRLYRFEGIKRRDNGDLHITSSRFDEPQCLALLSGCSKLVAVHGCEGDEHVIYLGGLGRTLRDAIRDHLDAAGFATGITSAASATAQLGDPGKQTGWNGPGSLKI
jgi:phage replication-related protein YjqB (UPF0714/DUF867 family)